MSYNILFEPEKLSKLRIPFTIFRKANHNGKVHIEYTEFTNRNIVEIFSDTMSDEDLSTLALLSEERVDRKKTEIVANYIRLRLRIDEDQFIKKHLANYFHDSFCKMAPLLSGFKVYHKVKIDDKRYRNSICDFIPLPHLRISFRLHRKQAAYSLEVLYETKGKRINSQQAKRYKSLLQDENTYYFLSKLDWLLLESQEDYDSFSASEFEEKIYPKLMHHHIDTDGVIEEETRNIEPDALLQVSELNGTLLMFIPKWDYDGTIVEKDGRDSFEIYENQKKIIYRRNKTAEKASLAILEEAHPNFKGKDSCYLTFAEASAKNWFFNFYHNELKSNFTVIGMDMLGYFRYSKHQIKSNFIIKKTEDNEVIAQFTTAFGKEKVAIKSLQKALDEEKKFVLLKDSSLGVLTDEWHAEYGLILKNSRSDGDTLSFAKWVLLAMEHTTIQKKNAALVLPDDWMKKWERWNHAEDLLYTKPKTVKAELRRYQQKGYEWMNLMAEVNAGTLLADDMGLGKTLQTITSMAYWLTINPKSRYLIVCPASLIYNWKNEFDKFMPKAKLMIFHGSNRNFSDFTHGRNPILITSYAILRNDIEEFAQMNWDGIVLDESHHIKNYQARQTQAVLRLTGKRRIILNGTPIMNDVSELFPQLKFLLPQLFHSPKKFRDQFEKPIKSRAEKGRMSELKKLTTPFILRRTKETAAPDLPNKTESILWCEMDADQRLSYETIKEQVKQNVFIDIKNKGLNKAKLGVLQGITKLRQVCSAPAILKDETDYKGVSSVKIITLIDELTSNLKAQKILIFSQFLGTMELLKRGFEENKINYRSFSGSTPARKRIELVSEFQDPSSDIQVFLLSLMAGNSGINLTNANYVFLVEPWWNKAVQQQAIDRTHRIGQNQKVFAYKMICKNTIEEKIIALQNRKQSLSDELITDDTNFVKNLTEADIAFLFD